MQGEGNGQWANDGLAKAERLAGRSPGSHQGEDEDSVRSMEMGFPPSGTAW